MRSDLRLDARATEHKVMRDGGHVHAMSCEVRGQLGVKEVRLLA